jgi:hypothetical protein
MSLDVIAWSNLKRWCQPLETLTELGLSSSEEVFTVEDARDSAIDQAGFSWASPELGTYWTTTSTETFRFEIETYRAWEDLQMILVKYLSETDRLKLAAFFNQGSANIGEVWGTVACAKLDSAFSELEGLIFSKLTAAEQKFFHKKWNLFRQAFKIGSQGGAVVVI